MKAKILLVPMLAVVGVLIVSVTPATAALFEAVSGKYPVKIESTGAYFDLVSHNLGEFKLLCTKGDEDKGELKEASTTLELTPMEKGCNLELESEHKVFPMSASVKGCTYKLLEPLPGSELEPESETSFEGEFDLEGGESCEMHFETTEGSKCVVSLKGQGPDKTIIYKDNAKEEVELQPVLDGIKYTLTGECPGTKDGTFEAYELAEIITFPPVKLKATAIGPLFWVKKVTLPATLTKEIVAEYIGKELEIKTASRTIKCSSVALKSKAMIEGAKLGTSDKNSETIEYSDCEVEGNGEGCILKGKKFTTNTLKSSLAYTSASRKKGSRVDMLFTTASGELAKVNFEAEAGGKCTVPETSLTGNLAAGVGVKAGGNTTVKENEPEGEVVELTFPGEPEVFKEESGEVGEGIKTGVGQLSLFKEEVKKLGDKIGLKVVKNKEKNEYYEWGIHTGL